MFFDVSILALGGCKQRTKMPLCCIAPGALLAHVGSLVTISQVRHYLPQIMTEVKFPQYRQSILYNQGECLSPG